MNKTIRREIKRFEKRAGTAARLRERAASFSEKASDIEVAQKSAFDAIMLKAAYDAGLDRLPLTAIVAGFATLKAVPTAEDNPKPLGAKLDFNPQPIEHGRDGQDVQADAAIIDLIVKIGRNTSAKRFAILDEHLTWNGKDGHWSNKVSPAVLKIFEGMFEPKRLIYPASASEPAEMGASNTTTLVDEVAADDSVGSTEPPTIDGKTEVDEVADASPSDRTNSAKVASADPSAATSPAANDDAASDAAEGGTEPARPSLPPTIDGKTEVDEVADASPSDRTSSVKLASADPSTTTSPTANDDAASDAAAGGTEPARSSEPLPATAVPRSPFASLRRRGGASQ